MIDSFINSTIKDDRFFNILSRSIKMKNLENCREFINNFILDPVDISRVSDLKDTLLSFNNLQNRISNLTFQVRIFELTNIYRLVPYNIATKDGAEMGLKYVPMSKSEYIEHNYEKALLETLTDQEREQYKEFKDWI